MGGAPRRSGVPRRARRAPGRLRRPADPDHARGPAVRGARARRSGSSARTSRTPARTRSTTRSARCSLARRLGKERIIAETGAGQHGVATATACALLGFPCVVYMGEEDTHRQAPNVARMQLLGAEVRPVTAGTRTLKEAVNEAMRDWAASGAHDPLRDRVGRRAAPVPDARARPAAGDRRRGARPVRGAPRPAIPQYVLACVGGGSNAIGMFTAFVGAPGVELIGVEAGGTGMELGRHCASLTQGQPGVLHGALSYLLQDADGQVDRDPLDLRRARLPGGRARSTPTSRTRASPGT